MEKLRKELAPHKTLIEAYYPIGHGDKSLINHETFTKLAKKYKKSNVQIILRWHIQYGNIVIPKSSNPAHLKENFEIFDFELTKDEMAEIKKLDQGKYYFNVPFAEYEKIVNQLADMNERNRMEYYFATFINHIEAKEYEKAYNLLYDEFRQRYFRRL